MGNTNCACHKSLPQKFIDNRNHSNLKIDVIEKPQTITPYENCPLINTININNYSIPSDNNNNTENFLITPEYQSTIECSYSKINKRPSFNCSLAGNEDDSVFSPESDKRSTLLSQSISEFNAETYEFLFKNFFYNNYPINDEIISEMKKYNLLSQDDASSFFKLPHDANKSKQFFDKFVFSETNISKLATFLFVITNEKSSVFYNLNKSEKLLSTIVDQIYFVINFLNLCQMSVDQIERIKALIYKSSLIKIHFNITNSQNQIIDNQFTPFYVEVHLDDMSLPTNFWSIFSKINEDFQCCQEIIISSCNLNSEDTYNLIQGLKASNILKILDVSTNPITDQGLKHIQSLFQMQNNIETLNLTCCSLTAVGVEEFLDVLVQNTFKFHLKSLNLSHNELDSMSENSILILTKLPLTNLQLQSTNLKNQKSLYESLKLNYSLKQLDMSRNKLHNKDLTYLASGLAYNNNLKSISLAMIGLSKVDCSTINNALLMNKSLISIDLSDNALGDEGIEILKDVLIMKKSLREIYLKRCNISLHGILMLLRQASEPDCHIRILDLCYNRCPRMSMVLDTKELIQKIYDILHQIRLVKNIKVYLWGTLDLFMPF